MMIGGSHTTKQRMGKLVTTNQGLEIAAVIAAIASVTGAFLALASIVIQTVNANRISTRAWRRDATVKAVHEFIGLMDIYVEAILENKPQAPFGVEQPYEKLRAVKLVAPRAVAEAVDDLLQMQLKFIDHRESRNRSTYTTKQALAIDAVRKSIGERSLAR